MFRILQSEMQAYHLQIEIMKYVSCTSFLQDWSLQFLFWRLMSVVYYYCCCCCYYIIIIIIIIIMAPPIGFFPLSD
jgi:hypothetical protein